ncbi:pitrilysin family protein [Streptomyces sp. AP-93]|uniref:M16 family metallopeptidase n=1 Tax=Streptomyces sp. AP-93 TaxID=2929048 RepID=UPI001FB01930|nr:insulinase family protein [Streptomyces sp. AP-93]MCJ0870133.1 insulinase family protein [Streptomyces sp. AP-93]
MITETTVDGVPVLLAPRPGPVTAGLFFRVGRADETLATSGITRLVRRLALHRLGPGDPPEDGAPAPSATFTRFQVTGTPAEVVAHLNGVCAALRDLPLERLETLKEILRTEPADRAADRPADRSADRAPDPAGRCAQWRYGSRSYGLTGYDEAGLPHLTAEQVRDWARSRFTAGNAVLWITAGAVPEGLDLTLPTGGRHPAPEATSALPALPARFRGGDGSVTLTSVLPRSTAARLFTGVLGRELLRELRQNSGYAYAATAEYVPRDAGSATVVAHAEALPQHQDAMAGVFVDVLAKLRAGRIEESALDAVRASALARLDTPGLAAARLPDRATDLLLGRPHRTPAEERAEIEAVGAQDLHEVARALWAGALVRAPRGSVDGAGLAAAPTGSTETVSGREYPASDDPGTVLTVAAEGVGLVSAAGRITVRYAECSLMQAYPDGARHLVGHDGFTLTVEPARFAITAAELAPLDAGVPPSAVVAMPPRTPVRAPRTAPQTPAPQTPAPTPAPAPVPAAPAATWFTVLLWVLGLPGMVIGASVLVLGLVMGDEHGQISRDNAWFLFKWLLVAGAALIPWAVCLRLRTAGRK